MIWNLITPVVETICT